MDRFHQGVYGLTGEMQTVAAARGTDIYLSGAQLSGLEETESKT